MNRTDALEQKAALEEQRRPSIGQMQLTEHEQKRLPLGNQYTDNRHKSIMEWQVVKAYAAHYEVSDWTSKVDPELTYEENCERMRQLGTYGTNSGPTCRELRSFSARLS